MVTSLIILFRPFPNQPWYRRRGYIAHAMGRIDKINYTNSLEAFEQSFAKGYRIFEIDFAKTADGVLVGRHSWQEHDYDDYSAENIPTAETFLNQPTFGSYTALSFADVLDLAVEYPDIYFVTDTKETNAEANRILFAEMIEIARDKGLLDIFRERFIIQFYNEEMYHIVMELLTPENVLYTAYKLKPEEYTDAILFCSEYNIPVITIIHREWTEELQELADDNGVKTAVHTINKRKRSQEFFNSGVSLLYSDSLKPEKNLFDRLLNKVRDVRDLIKKAL